MVPSFFWTHGSRAAERRHMMMRSLIGLSPALAVLACSGHSQTTGTSTSALTGPVEMRVAEDTDLDQDDVTASPPMVSASHIVVTITRVDARIDDDDSRGDDDGWTTLSVATRTVDLLGLPTGGF